MSDKYQKEYDEDVAFNEAKPSKNLWSEPKSPASVETPPQYPYNNVTKTKSGHTFEMDDTPNRERIRLQHRGQNNGTPGTFIEMHPTGDEVHKIYGDGYEIIIKNKNVLIKGTCNITINGDCNMEVAGDLNHKVGGDYNLRVDGKINVRGKKDLSISGDSDVSITASEKFGGQMRIGAADSLIVASDLVVGGSISADIISSATRVNAGTGVYAGPMGFTSSTGGISLGFPSAASPVAVPGAINAVASITSLVSVNAPVANFGLANVGTLNSVLMMDIINSNIYNYHVHPKTSTPLSRFVGV